MTIGTLRASVVLDRPEMRYCGTQPVTGHVKLAFFPKFGSTEPGDTVSDLFGPLRVVLNFHGRIKTKIYKRQGNHTAIYRGRVLLFSRHIQIYDDSFRAAAGTPGTVPFSITFPGDIETNGIGECWPHDDRFQTDPRQPLPPSFAMSYRGFAHHYESFIEYRIGVSVTMPNIDISIVTPDKTSEAFVMYERAQYTRATSPAPQLKRGSGQHRVSNELLLPVDERPKGFRQKARAAFSSDAYPTYAWVWTADIPTILHVGQPVEVVVQAQPKTTECTAALIPDIVVSSVDVKIKGQTLVRAEKQLLMTPQSSSETTVLALRALRPGTNLFSKAEPLSKANEWCQTFRTGPTSANVSSSFKTVSLAQSYSIQVSVVFTVAGKDFAAGVSSPLHILPPVMDDSRPIVRSELEAGPSAVPVELQAEGVSGTLAEETLPTYERPPGYEEGGSATTASTDDTIP